jgi:hypothetical protein
MGMGHPVLKRKRTHMGMMDQASVMEVETWTLVLERTLVGANIPSMLGILLEVAVVEMMDPVVEGGALDNHHKDHKLVVVHHERRRKTHSLD